MVIFVYGSLRRLEYNHRRFGADKLVDLGDTVTKPLYTLKDFGDYPGLYTGGVTAVIGELYEVDESNPVHTAVLAELERIEQYAGYERELILLADGTQAWAWVKDLRHGSEAFARGCPNVTGGDWVTHNAVRREARNKAFAEMNAKWDAEDAAARVRGKAPKRKR